MTDDDSHVELRGSPRRWVMLQTRIEDSSNVALAWTINVSDSGVLIERPADLAVQVGDIVSVVIEGLLAEDAGDGSAHAMAVVRVDEQRLALRFMAQA